MRKTDFFVIVIVLLLLQSCSKKEGVVGSRQRLAQIMFEETQTIGDVMIYDRPLSIGERWNWDGDELYRIDYSDESQFSEIFYYDRRGRISRTTVPAYKIERDFYYDGRTLERIKCYRDGELYCTVVFRHNDKHISGMDWQYESSAESDVSYDFEWKGDDVSKVICNTDSSGWECYVEYDNNYNPYHQLFGHYEMTNRFWIFGMLSENNVRSLRIVSDGDERYYHFDYEYSEHYPSKSVMSTSYSTADPNTLDEAVCTIIKTKHFSYK